jgi:hypothetical protein
MSDAAVVRIALDLLHVPSQVRLQRTLPLPSGVPFLLLLASGDHDATSMAVAETGRSPKEISEAATFFIEQILLCAESDSYRVLGANPDASHTELRRNMALLLSFLHPDKDGDRSVFAGRVNLAWDDLKTVERRETYDAVQQVAAKAKGERRRSRSRKPGHNGSLPRSVQRGKSDGLIGRTLRFLFRRPTH